MTGFRVCLLVFALSIDIFLAGFSYGSRRIFIPIGSGIIVSGFSAGALGIALLLGRFSLLVFARMASVMGGILLLGIGVWQLKDSLFVSHQVEAGDRDHNGVLSGMEAVSLGFALSLDCMAAGIGAGAADYPVLNLSLLCFLGCFSALYIGSFSGKWLRRKNHNGFSWLGGIILILLALWQIL